MWKYILVFLFGVNIHEITANTNFNAYNDNNIFSIQHLSTHTNAVYISKYEPISVNGSVEFAVFADFADDACVDIASPHQTDGLLAVSLVDWPNATLFGQAKCVGKEEHISKFKSETCFRNFTYHCFHELRIYSVGGPKYKPWTGLEREIAECVPSKTWSKISSWNNPTDKNITGVKMEYSYGQSTFLQPSYTEEPNGQNNNYAAGAKGNRTVIANYYGIIVSSRSAIVGVSARAARMYFAKVAPTIEESAASMEGKARTQTSVKTTSTVTVSIPSGTTLELFQMMVSCGPITTVTIFHKATSTDINGVVYQSPWRFKQVKVGNFTYTEVVNVERDEQDRNTKECAELKNPADGYHYFLRDGNGYKREVNETMFNRYKNDGKLTIGIVNTITANTTFDLGEK